MSDPSQPDPNSLAERWRRSQDDGRLAKNDRSDMRNSNSPDEPEVPARCPACRSRDLKTTSKVASVDAYWRCTDCGEVWNVARNRAGSRQAHDRPFRR
jgi:hypothetical protein